MPSTGVTRVTVGFLPSLEQLRRAFHHPFQGAALVETMRKGRGRRHSHLNFRSLRDPGLSSSSSLLFSSFPDHAPSTSPPFAIFRIRLSSQQSSPRHTSSPFILCTFSPPVPVDNLVFSAECLAPAYPARSTHKLLLAFCTKAHLSSAFCFNTKVGSPWNHSRGDSPVATSLWGGSV